MYEEFVKDFGGDDDEPGPKAFVRGGVIEPGKSSSAVKPLSGPRRHYVPPFRPPGMAAAEVKANCIPAKQGEVRPQVG